MTKELDQALAKEFSCVRCGGKGAHVERLAMTGTGLSAVFDVQKYFYAFVSCLNCGYTELYSLRILESKDDPRSFLKTLYADKARQVTGL